MSCFQITGSAGAGHCRVQPPRRQAWQICVLRACMIQAVSEEAAMDSTLRQREPSTVEPISPDQDICIAGDGTVHCHSRP